MPDHDQRFKTLLQTFLPEFFEAFLPEWRSQFDFNRVEWLETEAFPDPPQGERRSLDLVARLPVVGDLLGQTPAEAQNPASKPSDAWISLIHIEIDGGTSIAAFRPRMFDYFTYLRRKHHLPILPIALFLNLGLKGIGVDKHVEHFGHHEILRFRYWYVGLKALRVEAYLSGDNPLAAAFAGLMKAPRRTSKAGLKISAADAIRRSPTNAWQKYLLMDCLEAYFTLTGPELVQYDQLLREESHAETRTMVETIFDKAHEAGRRASSFRLALAFLERRFGPLTPQVRQRLDAMNADELEDLALRIGESETIEDLHLDG
jgi:hypothetical protein